MATNSKKEKFAKVRKEANAARSAAAIAAGDETVKEKRETKSGDIKGVSFRLPVETIQQLKELCALTGKSATGWIITAISEAHEMRSADIATYKKLQAK